MSSLILGAILLGFSPIFVKLVPMGGTAVGFYRCGLAALILGIYFLARPAGLAGFRKWPGGVWAVVFSAALLFAADLFFWHRSVWLAGAGIGTILANTQIFYVAAFGLLFLGERPTLRYGISVLAAIAGIFLLTRIPAAADAGGYLEGVLCGLATGLVYAGYILCLRRLKSYRVTVPFPQLLMAISFFSALALLLIARAQQQLRWPVGMEIVWLLLLAVGVQIIGWLLISRNLAKLPVSTSALIITLQPVVATILGVVVFSEQLSPPQMAGCGLTLIAIYLGSTRKNGA